METKRPLAKFNPKNVYKNLNLQLYHYDPSKFKKDLRKEKEQLDKSRTEIPDPKEITDIHKRVEIHAKKRKIKLLKNYMAPEHVNNIINLKSSF